MPAESKKDDRRTGRTRRSLSHALIELIQEKPYDEITVQDVIDRADVGRSTFYAHFRDKEDLFETGWEHLLDAFIHDTDWKNLNSKRFMPIDGLFKHLEDVKPFYRALLKSRKVDPIFKSGVIYMAKGIEAALSEVLDKNSQPTVPLPVISNYLSSQVFALLRWWLDQNMPHTPARMNEIFHGLVMPGVLLSLGIATFSVTTEHEHPRSIFPSHPKRHAMKH
jgi:AcrR family transcriptional regulator